VPSLPARSLLPVLSLVASGCAFQTPTPNLPPAIAGEGRPPAQLEVASVDVVSTKGTLDPEVAGEVRARTAKIFADAARKSRSGDGAAVVRVKVSLGEYVDDTGRYIANMALGFWLLAAPAGLAYDRQALSVDLTVTRGGRTFSGHGEAESRGGLYAPARKRALALALDRALADAARHERLECPGSPDPCGTGTSVTDPHQRRASRRPPSR
jgi:hypothetical protein